MKMPKVITSRKTQGTDFVFRVQAYRTLTDAEMLTALKIWMAQSKKTKIPKTGMVTIIGLHGFDSV